jgi:RNA polymerase sigma factor (TIGR02999 family)
MLSSVQRDVAIADESRSSASAAPRATELLRRAGQSDRVATNELFEVVYDELRRIAERFLDEERPGQTLQPTALVHEAYLRLVGTAHASWENRAHFFGAAAQAIRRILIDRARARGRIKRGNGERVQSLAVAGDLAGTAPSVDLLALDEALARLANVDAQKAKVVELRFFGGLTTEEIAAALGLSLSTVARDWQFARIWLHRELGSDGAR